MCPPPPLPGRIELTTRMRVFSQINNYQQRKKTWSSAFRLGLYILYIILVLFHRANRWCTPLYGFNGDVRPDRVWFSEDFCLERGIDFINLCLKQGIVTRPYVFINYRTLTKSQIFTSLPMFSIMK